AGLLNTPTSIVERPDAVELPPEGVLAFREVTFGYDAARPIVHGITLEIDPGEHVALVGATGAGKSTLSKLLTRQYDPNYGRIELGGIDLRDATLESLHRRVVLLPQEGHLFSGSIADNIRLAQPGATDDDAAAAAERD